MKRIHLILLFICLEICTLSAQENRLSKTIAGTSYEDLSVGFRQLDNSYLTIREGDRITYSYYLKDGEEILDGPFSYSTQAKSVTEQIEWYRGAHYHYKYSSPVIPRKETVKGAFTDGKCDGQWTWTTTANDEWHNGRYYTYVGKMTRNYRNGYPEGPWSMTLDMKVREGTKYYKEKLTAYGTFALGSYLPDKKVYHYAYNASFQDGKLSMKTDKGEIQNGRKVLSYQGGITFSDEDIEYIKKHKKDSPVYFYRDSLRYDVSYSEAATEFTALPLFKEDIRIGGYDRGEYFGFVDSQFVGSSLFYPAWNWGAHWLASSYCCDPYVTLNSVEKIVPLDRNEAGKYLNESKLSYFVSHYVLNTPLGKEDYEWAVAAADSTEKSINFKKDLERARDRALSKVNSYKHEMPTLYVLSFYDKDGRTVHLPDDLSPKHAMAKENSIAYDFYHTKEELMRRIRISRDIKEIDSLSNCMKTVSEIAERFNSDNDSRYYRYNKEVYPALQKQFPRVVATYIIDPKSKKTVGLSSTYYVNGWEDQAWELLYKARNSDQMVYTVFWKTLLYVKENIKYSEYETSADYYEAYYTKQLTLAKYYQENYSKARKIKTCEELLSAAGVTL